MTTPARKGAVLTIADGQSHSNAQNLGEGSIIGVATDSGWNTADLSFEVSNDNGATFVPLQTSAGVAIKVAGALASVQYGFVKNDQAALASVRYIRVVSSVPQTGDTIVTVLVHHVLDFSEESSSGDGDVITSVDVSVNGEIVLFSGITGDTIKRASGSGLAKITAGVLSTITPGTGIEAALAANVGSAGAPVLYNGAGGTPSGIALANGTGLPISTGLSGAGTGVLTALGVNVGSAGAFVTNGGALGSPSSAGTLPAFTLGGTISAGGNQINNVVIGNTTPLAGKFTTVTSTSFIFNQDGRFLGTDGNNGITLGANTIVIAGLLTSYNGKSTTGQGVAPIVGGVSQKSETASADTSVVSFTPTDSTVGTYRVTWAASVASATSGVISFTLSYKDSNGNTQTNVAQSMFQAGTAAPNTTFTTSAAGNYSGTTTIDIDNTNTAIVLKWVGGGTTSAKVSAWIERLK